MRRRLILANVILVAVVLGLLEVPLGLVYSRHEYDALNAALERDASSLAALSEEIIEYPSGHDVAAFARRFATQSGANVVIVDHLGHQLAPDRPVPLSSSARDALRVARTGHATTGHLRGSSYAALPIGAGEAHGAVLITHTDEALEQRVHRFWMLLAGIGAGVLAVSVAVSRRLARWAIDPLKQLDRRATELGHGALDVRADTTGGPPEVVALATTFNEMADRLDALVKSQRRFVAEASHQLRTPLTALRLRLENLDAEEADGVMRTREAALLETSRLTRLVDGLLTLARADGRRPDRHAVDIATIVAQRHEAWVPLAAERGVDLRIAADSSASIEAIVVTGHLEQILDNLIDNALDATSPGKIVTIGVVVQPAAVSIHVTDEGCGMTDAERERAFDPFWQGGNSHGTGGVGLGLAIVEQLVRASGGTVRLGVAESRGVDAVVTFPLVPRLRHGSSRVQTADADA